MQVQRMKVVAGWVRSWFCVFVLCVASAVLLQLALTVGGSSCVSLEANLFISLFLICVVQYVVSCVASHPPRQDIAYLFAKPPKHVLQSINNVSQNEKNVQLKQFFYIDSVQLTNQYEKRATEQCGSGISNVRNGEEKEKKTGKRERKRRKRKRKESLWRK